MNGVTGGSLTTHVLDTANGRPAAGVRLELFRLAPSGERELLKTDRTNADGRTDEPLIPPGGLERGKYEILFHVGEYFVSKEHISFLEEVPVRFGVEESGVHYHVPLLVSPGAYSTYRGS